MIFSTAQHNSVSMFSSHKLVPLKHIIFSVPRHTDHKIGKIGAKNHISCAENTPTAHIFNYPTIDINSQHPYLLGFDSNLVPNFNILVFQPYPGEDSEYSEKSGRFACNSASHPWEYPEYSGNSFRLVLFLAGYSRVHCKHRMHRLFRFGKKNPNNHLHLCF